jgi:hypothetical protein
LTRSRSASGSPTLPKGLLIELVTHAVEVVLADDHAEGVQIVHRAHLPEKATGNLREVDAAIHYRLAGRRFVRTVEVQDRGKRVGVQTVDQFFAKAQVLGVHRTTIVSMAGFTKPALDRIRTESDLLDAIHLRPTEADDWPISWPDPQVRIGIDGRSVDVPLDARTYCDALTHAALRIVLFGAIITSDLSGAVVYVLKTKAALRDGEAVSLARFLIGAFSALPGGGIATVEGDFGVVQSTGGQLFMLDASDSPRRTGD